LDSDLGKVGSKNNKHLKFKEATHLPCPEDELAELNDKILQLEFSKEG